MSDDSWLSFPRRLAAGLSPDDRTRAAELSEDAMADMMRLCFGDLIGAMRWAAERGPQPAIEDEALRLIVDAFREALAARQ